MVITRVGIIVSALLFVGLLVLYGVEWLTVYGFITPPARPVHSQELLDDLQLATTGNDHAGVDVATRSFVKAQHQPLRSLVSTNFNDLAFLRSRLEGKRVVLIGENSHGVAEFNWLRTRLVKYLHQELGYDVIAYESPILECDNANALLKTASASEVMKSAIIPVWHTAEINELFDYINSTRSTAKPITLAGLDTQTRIPAAISTERFHALLSPIAPTLAVELHAHEGRILLGLGERKAADLITFYQAVLAALENNRATLLLREKETAHTIDIAIQAVRSRIYFIEQLRAGGSTKEASEIRDRGMAENFRFLVDRSYPNRKIIVLASNHHIGYGTDDKSVPLSMGHWIADRRKQDLFSIGLFMGRGVVAAENRKPYRVLTMSQDTLTATMASAERKFSYFDFAGAPRVSGSEWIFQSINTMYGGLIPNKITPATAFDAGIYIDTVTPPLYVD
jgi:erythromycin esterase